MPFTPSAIFIFSLEPWGDMWYSKHHYAAYLAKHFPVYFVSLPDRWRWTDLFSFGVKVRTVKEGVKVVEYRNNLPLRLLPHWMASFISRVNAWKLRRLTPGQNVLYWCFHPSSLFESNILRSPGSKVIYHVVDPYQNLPNDTRSAVQCDLVVAINPWYLDYYGKLNPNCILVPHGVRREDRDWDAERVAAYKAEWGDYAVMAATINHRTNYGLLMGMAKKHPDLRLVLIGQLSSLEPELEDQRGALFSLPNVVYAGVKHPDILRDIIKGARIGLVTYDFEPTRSVPVSGVGTPLKVITYLAQGCPVVSTINSYAPDLDGKGAFKAEDHEHFDQLVNELLQGRKQIDVDTVTKYLDSADYEKLAGRILERLGEVEVHVPDAPPADGRPKIPLSSPILIISNEEWNGPRYSKHRYALALSQRRFVYFIDPVKQWKPIHFFKWDVNANITPEGVCVLSYRNAIPLLGGVLGGVNDHIVSWRIRKFLWRTWGTRPIFWSFDPSRLISPALLDPVISVYHCADDHGPRWEGEKSLASRCDHVFCIAHDLIQRFLPYNRSVHHAPHGLALTDMAPEQVDQRCLPAKPGYGLYIGNINDRHDFVLWERMFTAHPDVDFLIVGPVKVADPIGRRLIDETPYPNVRFLPAVPYTELQRLIAGSGFGFLFLKTDHPANRISSQKVIQFLAQGKPFFCSWFTEYDHAQKVVYMSDDPDESIQQLARWLEHGEAPERELERVAFARRQSFTAIFATLPFRL